MTEYALYILKAYSSLQNLSAEQITQFGRNQTIDENPIPSFDENLLINLCTNVKEIFEREDIVLEINGDTIIVGDLHGSFHDLLRIFKYVHNIPFKVIFLGDYVDRGQFSVECITLLFALKIMYPNKYFLLRGNHEFDSMCSIYGFKKEILNFHNPKKMYYIESDKNRSTQANSTIYNEAENQDPQITTEQLCDSYYADHINSDCYKYSEKLYDAFMCSFSFLPIAALVNSTSFCIHGGLSPHLDKVEKLRKQLIRPIFDYDNSQLICDVLWGDPSEEAKQCYGDNPRGRGKVFNGVVVVNFLKNNGLQRIIRAHECVFEGVQSIFNEKCITVFSASSYSHDNSNNSGILKLFQRDDSIEKVVLEPISRLKKCDALYYKVQNFSSLKKGVNQIHLRSMISYDFLKETERVNNSKLCKSVKGQKSCFFSQKMPFKVLNQSRAIRNCCSVPLNVAQFKEDTSLCFTKINDRLPMLSVENNL